MIDSRWIHRLRSSLLLASLLSAFLLGGSVTAQEPESSESRSPSDANAQVVTESSDVESLRQASDEPETMPSPTATDVPAAPTPARQVNRQSIIASLTIFVLAIFVGFEVITKVPPTLHTPLMSGSNAISGITLVGAVIVAATLSFSGLVGFVAVTLATVNAVGGFLVTHRMLAMFKKR